MTLLDTSCPFLAKSPYNMCIIRSLRRKFRGARGEITGHRFAMVHVHNVVYNPWFTFYYIKSYNYNFVKSYLGLRQIAGGVPRK